MLPRVVTSLLNLSEIYVAANFNNVESLCGFPETMAQSLFGRVAAHCQLVNKDMSEYLSVFVAAYGSVVLSSLTLPSLTVLNEYVERISCTFPHLTSLDLAHCHLGKSHDIFAGFQHMNNLKILLLNDCALENESLRKMTIPCRISKTGLVQLVFLDIADNPKLTSKCLPFFSCLRQLRRLKISTGPSGITKSEMLTCMKRFGFEETDCENVEKRMVSNEGWAAPVVQKWLISCSSPRAKKEHNSPSKFYGRPSRLLKRIKLDLDEEQSKRASSDGYLYLVKRETVDKSVPKFPKECSPPAEKPKCSIADDVLSGYLQNSSTNTNVCTKRSFFDYL